MGTSKMPPKAPRKKVKGKTMKRLSENEYSKKQTKERPSPPMGTRPSSTCFPESFPAMIEPVPMPSAVNINR